MLLLFLLPFPLSQELVLVQPEDCVGIQQTSFFSFFSEAAAELPQQQLLLALPSFSVFFFAE